MYSQFEQTFTFDDVLLVPQKSEILPASASLKTFLTPSLRLNLPFVSSPMDTVSEHNMAISIALAGGLGVIHKNLSVTDQVNEVRIVKRFENGFIHEPLTVHPDDLMGKVIGIRKNLGYKKVPVVDRDGKLVGFISDLDYLLPEDENLRVHTRMRHVKNLHLGYVGMSLAEAHKMIRDYRLRTLCIVDQTGRLVSLVTRSDLEKNIQHPEAVKNNENQLLVGAAIGVGVGGMERAEKLVMAGVDVLVVDTAHGHSVGVLNTVREIKNTFSVQVIAGNIATGEAAIDLVEAGADAVKVGIGPGSICTTRVVAGIGVPQLSAIMNVASGMKRSKRRVPVIADGGIKSSGDVVKALAAGAQSVMMGNMFAGTDEAPGGVEYVGGRMYKVYRGMGSLDAMDLGSKDRYGQGAINEKKKFVPEGVSGRVAYKGPVSPIIYQLAGGVRSGMGYNGAKNISDLQKSAKFVRITASSLKESHPHDLQEIKSAPNYNVEE